MTDEKQSKSPEIVTHTHAKDGIDSSAEYSLCERYRYALTRVWDAGAKRVTFIMLNPSKATEYQNDPTVERCERRARALGYGAFRVVNIFAWRETDPATLKKAQDPVGTHNDKALIAACDWADDIICGWGAHGDHMDRGAAVAALLHQHGRPLLCLGTTKFGHPRHPLYIGYATGPTPWKAQLNSQR